MEQLLQHLKPIITENIKTFIKTNTITSKSTKKIFIEKKSDTGKIGIGCFGLKIVNDPILIYYANPAEIGYAKGLRIGQHITEINGTPVTGKGSEFVLNHIKDSNSNTITFTYEEGTETIPYTEKGNGIGKTDIEENNLITVKDEYNQEVVLLVKPNKNVQDNQVNNKFSACVIKNVQIKEREKGEKKSEEEDSEFITKVKIDEILRNKENRSNDDLFFTIIKDPNFTLFNYYYRMYTKNNNKENTHVFFKYNAGANDTLGLVTDENLVITQVDAKKFGTSFKKGDKIKQVQGYDIYSIDNYKDKATDLQKTAGIKYITVKAAKIIPISYINKFSEHFDKNITSESTKKIIKIKDKNIADDVLSRLYHVGDTEVFSFSEKLKNEDDIILNSIFIHAIEIVYNDKQSSILEKEQMKYDEIQKILQEFRNMDKYYIEKENIKVAIAYTVDKEKANKLFKKTSTIGNIANNRAGRYIKNKLKRTFNSTFGLNSKNIAIEKASKLYETYIKFFILKKYEHEKDVDDFFKKNQLYKRLAKKFVLTQTDYTKYNENNIFSKDIEKIAELFNDLDIQDKIKKDIDNNVVSNDKDIINKKIFNYIGFCNVLSEISNLNNSITNNSITNNEDYEKILQVKEVYIKKQLDEIKKPLNEDVIISLKAYEKSVLESSIEKISNPEKIVQEFVDKGEETNIPYTTITNLFNQNDQAESTKTGQKGEEGEEGEENQTGGEPRFNKEKRSSSNRNFSLNEIESFIDYFKTITYDFKIIIKDSINDDDNNNNKTITSFMNKYLNILLGEKIKDNLSETDDVVIEKYKKGIINPQFLTEKIDSIDSYISLANTLMEKENGIVKKVLDSLRPKEYENNRARGLKSDKINIIKFERIKTDLMDMVIEHVTNINIVSDIDMEDNVEDKLFVRFQDNFDNKIGTKKREKEVSEETKDLLDSVFSIPVSDSKTIQEYKKKIRTIDEIIERQKNDTISFATVFTKLNNKNIFKNKFTITEEGITFKLPDIDMAGQEAKQKQSEKEEILSLLEKESFSQENIDNIKDALNRNAEETEQL